MESFFLPNEVTILSASTRHPVIGWTQYDLNIAVLIFWTNLGDVFGTLGLIAIMPLWSRTTQGTIPAVNYPAAESLCWVNTAPQCPPLVPGPPAVVEVGPPDPKFPSAWTEFRCQTRWWAGSFAAGSFVGSSPAGAWGWEDLGGSEYISNRCQRKHETILKGN